MAEDKTYVVRMSDGQEVKLKATQQLGTPATPYFVDERQDTIAGFGVVLGWWREECETKSSEQAVSEPVPSSTAPASAAKSLI